MIHTSRTQLNAILPDIPLIDSPLFPALLDCGAFGPHTTTAQQLHDEGLAVINLGEERMKVCAQAIKAALADQFDLESWKQANTPAGLRVQDAWTDHDIIQKLALDSEILEILRAVYGREPFAFQTLNFPVGTQQHLHSDAIHFQSEPAGFMCGVWIPLEEIHPDSGPLLYVPGSHRLPYLQAHEVGHHAESNQKPKQDIFHRAWLSMIQAQRLPLKTYTPKLGEALIWSANLLHGGSEVRDRSRTRWSQVTHYFFENCRHYTPIHSDWPHGTIAWRSPQKVGQPLRDTDASETVHEADAQTNLSKLNNFDPTLYLKANPDVEAAGINPYEHLIRYGLKEGRRWSP